jgi:hypothetical protein
MYKIIFKHLKKDLSIGLLSIAPTSEDLVSVILKALEECMVMKLSVYRVMVMHEDNIALNTGVIPFQPHIALTKQLYAEVNNMNKRGTFYYDYK